MCLTLIVDKRAAEGEDEIQEIKYGSRPPDQAAFWAGKMAEMDKLRFRNQASTKANANLHYCF